MIPVGHRWLAAAWLVLTTAVVVAASLGALRLHLAHQLDLIAPLDFDFLWVTDFPLFEYDERQQRLQAIHHPFTCLLYTSDAADE